MPVITEKLQLELKISATTYQTCHLEKVTLARLLTRSVLAGLATVRDATSQRQFAAYATTATTSIRSHPRHATPTPMPDTASIRLRRRISLHAPLRTANYASLMPQCAIPAKQDTFSKSAIRVLDALRAALLCQDMD